MAGNILKLERFAYTPFGTFGRLVFGSKQWFTIEPPWLDNKPNVSCIPIGRYRMKLEYSPKFKRDLWELKDVPNRFEIKIHAANVASQLQGCIAPGKTLGTLYGKWAVKESASALRELMSELADEKEAEIEITNYVGGVLSNASRS